MIFTLTLNPALDLEYRVDRIEMGEIHRSVPARADWGGKGFNVSRVLRVLGEESTAVGFAGGHTGRRLAEGLEALGIRTELVWTAGETRTNISVVGADGGYIKVNEPGPEIAAADVERLLERVSELTGAGDLWVMSGSLPRGVAADFYAAAIRRAKARGGRVLLDTSGKALAAAWRAGPDLLKPNAEEAAELTGLAVTNAEEAVRAARAILAGGAARVVLSMGGQGAAALEGEQAWFAPPLEVAAANPVGAGDALVAGLAAGLARGWSLPELLRLGSACGACAAATPGTGIGPRAEIDSLFAAAQVQPLPIPQPPSPGEGG